MKWVVLTVYKAVVL